MIFNWKKSSHLIQLSKNAEEIKEVLVRLYSENGFPVDVKTQLYFEDSITNTLIDSLFLVDRVVSKAALVDSDGNPVGVSSQITDVVMESDRVDRVMNANRVRAQAYLSTTTDNNGNQPDVKIYSDDGIMIIRQLELSFKNIKNKK